MYNIIPQIQNVQSQNCISITCCSDSTGYFVKEMRYLLYLTFKVIFKVNYDLRTNDLKMSLPKPKTDFLKKSFAYHGAVSWNKLPSNILRMAEECQSVNSFSKFLDYYFRILYK